MPLVPNLFIFNDCWSSYILWVKIVDVYYWTVFFELYTFCLEFFTWKIWTYGSLESINQLTNIFFLEVTNHDPLNFSIFPKIINSFAKTSILVCLQFLLSILNSRAVWFDCYSCEFFNNVVYLICIKILVLLNCILMSHLE